MHTSAPHPQSPSTLRATALYGNVFRRFPTLGRIRGSDPHPAMWPGIRVFRPSPSSEAPAFPRQPTARIRCSAPGPVAAPPAAVHPVRRRLTGWGPSSWGRFRGWVEAGGYRAPIARPLFVGIVVIAGLIPALLPATPHPSASRPLGQEAAWPQRFEGRPLTRLPLSAVDQRFADRFPGQIGRFTDGRRIIIVRSVQEPTRMLHPASVCFRGIGYRVGAPRAVKDGKGITWSCFGATRDGEQYRVCERIYDLRGGAWTDASSWYWAALLGRTERPWYALTVVTQR